MSIRACIGQDDGLIKFIDIDGDATDNPELAIEAVPCDCGSIFDDEKHELTWPHRILPPARPSREVIDLPLHGYF